MEIIHVTCLFDRWHSVSGAVILIGVVLVKVILAAVAEWTCRVEWLSLSPDTLRDGGSVFLRPRPREEFHAGLLTAGAPQGAVGQGLSVWFPWEPASPCAGAVPSDCFSFL